MHRHSQNRKKKGRAVHGWLVLDKPHGMGSTDAVNKVKWLFGAEKAGHAGTLDPLATGILPIALGDATKTVPYVQDGTKVYRFTVAWGSETATDDLEGAVTNSSATRPTRDAIEAILPRYVGIVSQVPPQFSAVKIDGERAYDLARAGGAVEIAAREVEIDEITILDHSDDATTFEAVCGKGVYVRSLARDFGRELGCFGHVSDLRRTEVSPFTEDAAVSLADLEAAADEAGAPPPRIPRGEERPRLTDEEKVQADAVRRARAEAVDRFLLDTGAALDGLPEVVLSDDQARKVRLGNPVILRGRDAPLPADEAYATAHGRLVAIGEVAEGEFRPRRVFGG